MHVKSSNNQPPKYVVTSQAPLQKPSQKTMHYPFDEKIWTILICYSVDREVRKLYVVIYRTDVPKRICKCRHAPRRREEDRNKRVPLKRKRNMGWPNKLTLSSLGQTRHECGLPHQVPF